jgi:hypothetical protein
MSNYNKTRPKDIILNEKLSNKELMLCEPNKYNDNFYGSLALNNQLFRNDELEFYKNDLKNVVIKINKNEEEQNSPTYNIQTLKLNRGNILDAFKKIDNWMLEHKKEIEEKTKIDNLDYRPLVREWIGKTGNEGRSSELRFQMKKDGSGYNTIFFDNEDNEIKLKTFDELEAQVGYKTNAKVRLVLDYQVISKKNEYCVLPKIKFLQIKKDENTGPVIDPETAAIKVNEIDFTKVSPNLSFLKGNEEMSKTHKFLRVLWGEKPGKRFRFDNFIINKKPDEKLYVGVPGKEYESNKIFVVLEGSNLLFLDAIDNAISERVQELREGFELTKKTQKLEYIKVVNTTQDRPVVKLTFDMNPEKKTKFYIGGELLEWETIDDVRNKIPLGTEIKNPNIIISKISYIPGKKEAYLKLKLKSCTLILPKNNRAEYVASGKFNNESDSINTDDAVAKSEIDDELC